MNISGNSIGSYYKGYYGNLSISDSKDGSTASVNGKSSARKQDSVQFSAEAMERFKETRDNGGVYDPSRVELSTDDKKQILERVKQEFGTDASADTSDAANSSGTEQTKGDTDELAALKNALKSLDLDSATNDEINSAFTQLTSAIRPSGGQQGQGEGPRGAGGPPPGGRPPGPPPGGMRPGGGASAAGGSDSTETTAQKLLEALTSAYDDEDEDDEDSDDTTASASSAAATAQTSGTDENKTDYAARLKEQLAKFRTEHAHSMNDDVYELLLQKLDDWASPSAAGSADETGGASGEDVTGQADDSAVV